MGANEKYAAAMHGYVPDEKQLRNAYLNVFTGERNETSNAEFDRGIAKIRAEAKAEALNEAADDIVVQFGKETVMGFPDPDEVEFPTWLRARANQYKEAPSA